MSNNINIICPICGHKKGKNILIENKIPIVMCLNCDLQFVWPLPKKEAVKSVYEKKYFIGNTQTPKGYANYDQLENELLKESKKRLDFIQKYSTGKELLDVGCGTGVFLEEAEKQGYKGCGNEISSYALKKLKEKKIRFIAGAIEDCVLPKEKFDLVTAWDVIEHLTEIKKVIRKIGSSLKRNGFLFITTPNTQSIDSKLMGKRWYNYQKAPEHLFFLNKKSVSQLFKGSKFRLISIVPWGFYRKMSFFIERLKAPPWISKPLLYISNLLRLSNRVVFFPFTDFMLVAQKK